jgi:hypothetical protein
MRKLVLLLAASQLATAAQAQIVQPDFLEMAKASASLNGIPVTEAIRRIDLQGRIIDLQNKYLERFPNEFAGVVIDASPATYGYRVLLKGQKKNALLDLAGAADLAAIGREEVVARSFSELRDDQTRILDSLWSEGIKAGSSIDLAANKVKILTLERAKIERLVAEDKLRMSDFTTIVDGDPTIKNHALIRGGLTVEGLDYGCQTGFSVRNYSGVRGVVTAGHCDDALNTLSGVSIGALQAATTGTQYQQGIDLQWHASTTNTYPNEIQYGSTVVKISSAVGISLMVPSQTEVCLVRYRTQTTSCGKIYNTAFYGDHPTYGRSGPFVGVAPAGALLLAEVGDSGGPWFFGSKAYGIHSGSQGSIAVFTPVEKLSSLSVVLQTN